MMKLGVLLGAVLVTPMVYADDSGFYAGLGGGIYANTLMSNDSFYNPISHNGTPTGTSASLVLPGAGGGYRIFGGYNFNRYIGVEAGFNQNYASDIMSTALTFGLAGQPNFLQLNTYDVEAVGYLPIFSTNLKLLGKLGLDYNVANFSFGDLSSGYSYAASGASGNNFSIVAGVGLEWDLFNSIILRTEYVNYGNVTMNSSVGELGTANNGVVDFSVGYKF